MAGNPRMLITSDPHETRVAILEGERLSELAIERHRQRGCVGNIYKGRVRRILPGIQAAFVDIGLERDAFLYVGDMQEHRGDPPADAEAEAEEADEHLHENLSESIEDLLKQGQEIVVQVVKDPQPQKGARLTTYLALPGRDLVLLPEGREHGISRRIVDDQERQRLRELLGRMPLAHGAVIVRTVGEGKSQETLDRERGHLESLWQRILRRAEMVKAPSLVHREWDLAVRMLRDRLDEGFSTVTVEGDEVYARLVEFLRDVQPALVDRLMRYEDEPPLFERYGMEEEIEKLLAPRVWLKSGGHLVINPTEALVAIDVNTGRNVGRDDLEETILQTNLEAVVEAVRQIRLRDLGGIIVLDLIDMEDPEHRQQVLDALERELARDRARSRMLTISEFGLVEITRERSRSNLQAVLTAPCSCCDGSGRVKSASTICLDLRRQLLRRPGLGAGGDFVVRTHPEILRALQEEESPILEELERAVGGSIVLQGDPTLERERFEIDRV